MLTIGVDLGGTNLRVAAFGGDGTILSVHREPLPATSPRSVLEAISAKTRATAEEAGGSIESVGALCVALAGQIHRPTGIVALGPNLRWLDVPFGEMLSTAFPFPVRLENDLSAAAWGERAAGAGKGADNVVLVAVGSGVGAGLIEGGRLVDGVGGLAGEIGHSKVVPGGEPCGCGERGCLEAYTGGHRMTARALSFWALAGVSRPMGVAPHEVSMKTVSKAFEAGDEVARRVLEEAGDHLGLATANLVTILNPSRLVLGGGVLLGVPYLARRVREAVGELTSAPARGQVTVELAALGDDAGLIGAGHLAREIVTKDPA